MSKMINSDVFNYVNVLDKAADGAWMRNQAIAHNIANVDTPGYIRQDVNFSQYLSTMNSPLETKLSTKLGPSGILEEREKQEIDIAEELAEMQKNSLLYTMATRRMSNIINQMKTVINVGK